MILHREQLGAWELSQVLSYIRVYDQICPLFAFHSGICLIFPCLSTFHQGFIRDVSGPVDDEAEIPQRNKMSGLEYTGRVVLLNDHA